MSYTGEGVTGTGKTESLWSHQIRVDRGTDVGTTLDYVLVLRHKVTRIPTTLVSRVIGERVSSRGSLGLPVYPLPPYVLGFFFPFTFGSRLTVNVLTQQCSATTLSTTGCDKRHMTQPRHKSETQYTTSLTPWKKVPGQGPTVTHSVHSTLPDRIS